MSTPTSTPSRALSKGTLGLKFMNKVQPKALISKPVIAPSKTSILSTPIAELRKPVVNVKKEEVVFRDEKVKMEEEEVASTSQRRIVHEGSLLSFPLLSSTNSSSSRFSSSSSNYSSMPWTTSVVSGRRSYGGANIEIEQLNNPTIAATLPSTPSTTPAETASQKKKRKSREKDEQSVDVRTPSFPLVALSEDTSFKSNTDEIKLGGGGKKPRFNDSPSNYPAPPSGSFSGGKRQFEKPKGFDGARFTGTSSSTNSPLGGKGKGKGTATLNRREEKATYQNTRSRNEPEEEPVWGERGTERAWDVGKEEEVASDSASDEVSSEEEDSSDEEEMLVDLLTGKDQSGRRVKREEEMAIDVAIEMEERDFDEDEMEGKKLRGKRDKRGGRK